MALNRRTLLQSMPAGIALGALSLPARPVLGQSREATPAANPPGPLEDALLAIEPDRLLSRLMTSKVTTPLFPSDTGQMEAQEWVDDSDLFGSVGGVQIQTGADQNNNFIGPGVYLILRDQGDATERRESVDTSSEGSTAASITIGGFPGITIVEPNDVTTDQPDESMESNAFTLLQVGYLLISALANGPADGSTELRSVANAIGLLDHLRMVVQASA